MEISKIKIGDRHRKDFGDIDALARSIEAEGLLQPIGITPDSMLVFGERRIRAFQLLGREDISARVVNVSSIAAGEWTENELRKNFTPSEIVAIVETIRGYKGDDEKHPANWRNGITTKQAVELLGISERSFNR